ncbi:MAG: hypothetical protein IH621_06945 [Krumholzibacteria bacterium]|nr:hypothetical protein [Candidatus Krumholzibacteria bacterium]
MRTLLTVLAITALTVAAANADVLFDNFGPGDTFSTTSGHTIGGFIDQHKAVGLTIPAGEPVVLNSVTVPVFQNYGGAGGPWGFIRAYVYPDEFGVPSRYPLEFVAHPSTQAGNVVITIPFSGTTILEPGATYWFALNNATTEEFFWRNSTPSARTLPFAMMFGDDGAWSDMTGVYNDPAIRVEVSPAGVPADDSSWSSVKALFR